MSIKATQPEDSAVTALRMHHEWSLRNMPGYSEHGDERVAYRATVAALVTPSPQPAEAKTAAVDGMTDAEIYAWWASENGLEDCNMCKLDDFRAVVRAVEKKLAAIATQERT